MSRESRPVISLSELKAVEFRCKACATRLAIEIDRFDEPPARCPQCNVEWIRTRSSPECAALQSLVDCIVRIIMLERESRFGVTLELRTESRPDE